MSSNPKILVTGLPGFMTLRMLVLAFKALFKKVYIRKFWIRELSDIRDSDYKQMTVEFKYKAEAKRAQNFLNSKQFLHNTTKYPLVVQIVEEFTEVRTRSWSPHNRQEFSKFGELSPCASQEFDRHREYESQHRRYQPDSVPQRSQVKYPPKEKDRSNKLTHSSEWSRNSRHPTVHSRDPSVWSRQSPTQSKYPSVRSRHSTYSPGQSRNSRRCSPAQ